MDAYQNYTPSLTQQSTNGLYGNHFRFSIARLPDLSFFVQSARVPLVSSTPVLQTTPFSTIKQAGDHLTYSSFDVTYLVDARLRNYFSLYYWMKGYGFPHSFDEVVQFRETQLNQMGNFRARASEIERTTGLLHVLTPDTGSIVAEIHFEDIFPTGLSQLSFDSTIAQPTMMVTTASFACSTFDVKLMT